MGFAWIVSETGVVPDDGATVSQLAPEVAVNPTALLDAVRVTVGAATAGPPKDAVREMLVAVEGEI